MTPERRQQVESLCLEALAREGGARTAFLDGACAGDAALRREVDSLLAGQAGAAGFLKQPAWLQIRTGATPAGGHAHQPDPELVRGAEGEGASQVVDSG